MEWKFSRTYANLSCFRGSTMTMALPVLGGLGGLGGPDGAPQSSISSNAKTPKTAKADKLVFIEVVFYVLTNYWDRGFAGALQGADV